MKEKAVKKSQEQLLAENEDLRARLDEAEDALRAIQSGEVDALVVSGEAGDQIFTLQSADQSYRMLVENMNEGALTLTMEGEIIYANLRFSEILRTPLEKVIGSSIYTWILPDSSLTFQSLLRRDVNEKHREELVLTADDGTPVPVHFSVSDLFRSGTNEFLCVVVTDLTERKRNEAIALSEQLAKKELTMASQARVVLLSMIEDQKRIEAALRQAQKQLNEAHSLVHMGIWESDMKSGDIFWSDEMYRIYGFADERFKPSFEIFLGRVHPEDRAFVIGAVESAIKDNKPHGGDFRIALPDGTVRYIHAEEELLLDDTGRPVGLRGTAQDITERKQMEEALKDYSETLEEKVKERTAELEKAKVLAEVANIAKSGFLANMSHELRTPLNHIIGFSEMMSEGMVGTITDKQKEYIGNITESGRRLFAMINDVLELSRIEIGESTPVLKNFSLRQMLEKDIEIFRDRAMLHNIKLGLDMGDSPETITSDQTRLRQVILSLLSNAFKFTPDGGSVRVSAKAGSRGMGQGAREDEKTAAREEDKDLTLDPWHLTHDGNFIEISVEDTGIGIAKEDMERLFVPFQQLEPHLTKKYGGVGLGLYLAKRLVEILDGRIWVESEIGKGSKFSVVIPMRQRQNSESRSQESE